MPTRISRAGIIQIGDPRRASGWALGWAEKDSAVTSSARHMRHTCRAVRAGPDTPPRKITEVSVPAARAQRLAMMKAACQGWPSRVPVGLAMACPPRITAAAPTPRMNTRANGSKRPVRPGPRTTAAQPVAVR